MHHLCPLLTKKSQTQRRSILPTHQKKDGSCSSVGQSVPFVIFFCKNGGPGFYRKKKIRNMGYARCSRNVRPSPYSIPIPQGDAWTRFSLTRPTPNAPSGGDPSSLPRKRRTGWRGVLHRLSRPPLLSPLTQKFLFSLCLRKRGSRT